MRAPFAAGFALDYAAAPSVSVVIPTLNEADNLPLVLPRIPDWVREIVIVDGLSTDNTVAVARALSSKVRVVLERGRGKGIALRRGFDSATGDIIVAMDADGSTRPEEIGVLVGKLLSGADFVHGSRFAGGAGSADITEVRRLGTLALLWVVKTLFGKCYTDLNYGFNALWRRLVPILALDAVGFEVEAQMQVRALRLGLKVAEAPCYEEPRIYGQGHLSAIRDGWRVLKTILREFWLWLGERHPAHLPAEDESPLVWEGAPVLRRGGVHAESAPMAPDTAPGGGM